MKLNVFMFLYQTVQKGGLVLAALSTVIVMEQSVILLQDTATVQLAKQETTVVKVNNRLQCEVCSPRCRLWITR